MSWTAIWMKATSSALKHKGWACEAFNARVRFGLQFSKGFLKPWYLESAEGNFTFVFKGKLTVAVTHKIYPFIKDNI